ncbi:MAG: hypothetical protein LEGION0403_FIIPPAGN_01098 [Legionella sp.]
MAIFLQRRGASTKLLVMQTLYALIKVQVDIKIIELMVALPRTGLIIANNFNKLHPF